MNLFRISFVLSFTIASIIGHSSHPFCLHPLYQAVTDSEEKASGEKLTAIQENLLTPFFVLAILQKPSVQEHEEETYSQTVAYLNHELRRLAMKKIWHNLSKNERQTLLKVKDFHKQLEQAHLAVDDPLDSKLFALGKMEKILKNKTMGLTDYSIKDLVLVLSEQELKSKIYVAIKAVCQNLAPVPMPDDDSSQVEKIGRMTLPLALENTVAFKELLNKNFGLRTNLTTDKLVWEMNLTELNPLITLKNILLKQEYEQSFYSDKLFLLIKTFNSLPKNMAFIIASNFFNHQLADLTTMLDGSDKFLTFFNDKNMQVLEEFIRKYKIKALKIPAAHDYEVAQSLYFSNPHLEEKIRNLIKMKRFLGMMSEQVRNLAKEETYADFFKNYYHYHNSLTLVNTLLDEPTQIAADRMICDALGLSFPCFHKVKIAQVRLSRQSVFLDDESDENLSKLKTHVGYHLTSLADFVINLIDNSTRIGRFAEDLLAINKLTTTIHLVFKNNKDPQFEDYLPYYNDLRANVERFQRLIISDIRNNLRGQIRDDVAQYLNERLTHLL